MKITPEIAHELFTHVDGELFYKEARGRVKVGDKAGRIVKGRHRIAYHGVVTQRARVIYMMHHGAIPDGLVIDHIDRNPMNDRIENLRAITQRENLNNTSMFRHNTTGYRFISKRKNLAGHRPPWRVNITREFYTEQEALAFRDKLLSAWTEFEGEAH